MKRLFGSLVFKLALVLVVAGLLPLGISVWQLRTNRDALLEQVLRTHLVAAAAAAARVDAFLDPFLATAGALAENPVVFESPRSTEAQELLRGTLLALPAAGAIGLFDEHGESVILLQTKAVPADGVKLPGLGPEGLALLRGKQVQWLLVRRPFPDGVGSLVMLVDATSLQAAVDGRELGEEAHLVLASRDGQVVAGADELATFPPAAVQAAQTGMLAGGSKRYETDIVGYAAVERAPWFVLARQPAEVAEVAERRIVQATGLSAIGVLVLSLVLLRGGSLLTRSLAHLAEFARAFSRHGFEREEGPAASDELIQIGRRNDEVGTLARAFDRMRSDLFASVARLKETTAVKERMASELAIGRDIQFAMVPKDFAPAALGDQVQVYAALRPTREVGGDFYDFFALDGGRLGFCVGDVSGKGVPAALLMAVGKTLVKASAGSDPSPASVLTQVNHELSADDESGMFITIFLGVLNLKTGDLTYSNAGHNPPFLRRASGEVVALDARHGPVVGGMPGVAYRESRMTLAAGEQLLLYTDGVTEARDAQRGFFGEARLRGLIERGGALTARQAVEAVIADVEAFEQGVEQADDITVLVVSYAGHAAREAVHRVDLRIANALPEIAHVTTAIKTFAREKDLPTSLRRRLSLALDELLNNIISYAYEDAGRHEIEVQLELEGDRFRVTVVDDGRPFNPFDGPPAATDVPLDERGEGGLGIHLVRAVMDEISYVRRSNRNVVTLAKQVLRDPA
ncbi:MAG: SpoIIE family protein phosphatase [Vicinamibacteria bacterium]|nr:SpoIIE family protein phosphatase [Vicinamibacteria bacterium]